MPAHSDRPYIICFSFIFRVIGFFKLFGITYESNRSIFLLILSVILIGSFFEFIGKILLTAASVTVKNKALYRLLKMITDFIISFITLYIADSLVSGIFIPQHVLIVAAAILSLTEAVFDRKQTA
ncbi:YrvL family regulatory protein [Bacillus amyloliquefaciens]|uniref:YrvL family regulatory protein n=1 Tax=Bacillus amyloliquefaciens TaxID=1390 RepID=UPI003A836A58